METYQEIRQKLNKRYLNIDPTYDAGLLFKYNTLSGIVKEVELIFVNSEFESDEHKKLDTQIRIKRTGQASGRYKIEGNTHERQILHRNKFKVDSKNQNNGAIVSSLDLKRKRQLAPNSVLEFLASEKPIKKHKSQAKNI